MQGVFVTMNRRDVVLLGRGFMDDLIHDLASGKLEVWWTEGPDLENTVARVFAWAMTSNDGDDVAGLVLTGGLNRKPYTICPWIHNGDKAAIILAVNAIKEGAL